MPCVRHAGWGPAWGWCGRPVYRSFYRNWRAYSFCSTWARPWFGGCTVAYWSPGCYESYCGTWVDGAPAFGFGQVYYGPTYNEYFPAETGYEGVEGPAYVEEPVYADEPVYAEEPVVYETAPAPVAAESLPEAPESLAISEAEAPGLEEFEAGVEDFLAGAYVDALVHFRTAAELEPENGEVWMAVAHAGFAAARYRDAAEGIAEAGELGAFPRGYRYDPKSMYPEEGRFEALLAQLETWRTKHPEDANAHLVAAYFHVALGEPAEASQAIVGVLTVRPEDQTAPLLNVAMLPPLPPEASPDAMGPAPAAQGGSASSPAAAASVR